MTIQTGKIINLATSAHRKQKRDNGDSYIIHPIQVAFNVLRYLDNIPRDSDLAKITLDVYHAAILHDVLEDCGDSYRYEIWLLGGRITYGIVDELTREPIDDGDPLIYAYGGRSGAAHFKLINKARKFSDGAKLIKLYDRLCNVNDSVTGWNDKKRILKYAERGLELYEAMKPYSPELENAYEWCKSSLNSVINSLWIK